MCTTPHAEQCAQLGERDYRRNARLEDDMFIDQLQRIYGTAPQGSYFKIVDCPHDFGVYLDVRFTFDEAIDGHVEYLNRIQESTPCWDDVAKDLLARLSYRLTRYPLKVTHRAA